MKRDTMYGGALFAGTLGSFVTMAMHPTGSQLLADVRHMAPVVMAIHVLALVTLPFSVFGTLGLTRVLGAEGELPVAAMVSYAMASAAVMIAAVASELLAMSIGHLRLDVHGFGAVVRTQGIWMITVGVLLIRDHELSRTS